MSAQLSGTSQNLIQSCFLACTRQFCKRIRANVERRRRDAASNIDTNIEFSLNGLRLYDLQLFAPKNPTIIQKRVLCGTKASRNGNRITYLIQIIVSSSIALNICYPLQADKTLLDRLSACLEKCFKETQPCAHALTFVLSGTSQGDLVLLALKSFAALTLVLVSAKCTGPVCSFLRTPFWTFLCLPNPPCFGMLDKSSNII